MSEGVVACMVVKQERERSVRRNRIVVEQLTMVIVAAIHVLEALCVVLKVLFIRRACRRDAARNRTPVGKEVEGSERRRFKSVLHDSFWIVRDRALGHHDVRRAIGIVWRAFRHQSIASPTVQR